MALDFSELLRPFDAEYPCGLEVRFEPGFDDLFAAAEPEPSRINDPVTGAEVAKVRDWSRIRQKALDLTQKGRDLRVEILLLRGLVGTQGFPGLADGLRLVRLTLERDWETLWPALEAEEQDPAERAVRRLNTLQQLNDPERLLAELRRAPLVSARGHEPVSLRDLELAKGPTTGLLGEPVRDLALIDAAFGAAPADELHATAVAIEEGTAELTRIGAVLAQKLGNGTQAPDFAPLRRVLERAAEALGARPPTESKAATEGMDHQVAPPRASSEAAPSGGAIEHAWLGRQAGSGVHGQVGSREDVLCALDLILEYYERHAAEAAPPQIFSLAWSTNERVPSPHLDDDVVDVAFDDLHMQDTAVISCGGISARDSTYPALR